MFITFPKEPCPLRRELAEHCTSGFTSLCPIRDEICIKFSNHARPQCTLIFNKKENTIGYFFSFCKQGRNFSVFFADYLLKMKVELLKEGKEEDFLNV